MTEFKEPELFLLRKSKDEETQSWLYQLMKNVKRETITHFNDPELNTFFHQEKRQKESLYQYVVIRHMLDKEDRLDKDINKDLNKNISLSAEITPLVPIFNFSGNIELNSEMSEKEYELDLNMKRNLLTSKECKLFKSKNALYFIANDEYSIGDIISSVE